MRYRFGNSLLSDTINADLITNLFGQTIPYDVELVKQDSTYFLITVGTTNRLVAYNIGTNPLSNSTISFHTIVTNSLSPLLTDPRSVTSKTICDTTVVFICGRTSNSINRLLFSDLNNPPLSVEGVATSQPWSGPFNLLLEIDQSGLGLYVQQRSASPLYVKFIKSIQVLF